MLSWDDVKKNGVTLSLLLESIESKPLSYVYSSEVTLREVTYNWLLQESYPEWAFIFKLFKNISKII